MHGRYCSLALSHPIIDWDPLSLQVRTHLRVLSRGTLLVGTCLLWSSRDSSSFSWTSPSSTASTHLSSSVDLRKWISLYNKVVGGYIGFTLSVRPSRITCPLCSAYSSGWIHFIFTHLIKQLQKVCCVSKFLAKFQNLNFGGGGISERRRSSCSSCMMFYDDC